MARRCAPTLHPYVAQSRVIKPNTGERNYHIFYIINYLPPDQKKAIKYDSAEQFHYCKLGGCTTVEGINDEADFKEFMVGLHRLNQYFGLVVFVEYECPSRQESWTINGVSDEEVVTTAPPPPLLRWLGYDALMLCVDEYPEHGKRHPARW